MTTDATIQSMPRARGVLSDVRKHELEFARDRVEHTQREYRRKVLGALEDGASFSWVSEVTGLSTNTLQRWKREAGK
jgi:uncharacterized protein YerC